MSSFPMLFYKRRVSPQNFLSFSFNPFATFLLYQKLLIFIGLMLMSAERKKCVTWFIYSFGLLWVRYNCAKFHHCRMCGTDLKRESLFDPSIREQPRKGPSWIGLKMIHNNEQNDQQNINEGPENIPVINNIFEILKSNNFLIITF